VVVTLFVYKIFINPAGKVRFAPTYKKCFIYNLCVSDFSCNWTFKIPMLMRYKCGL